MSRDDVGEWPRPGSRAAVKAARADYDDRRAELSAAFAATPMIVEAPDGTLRIVALGNEQTDAGETFTRYAEAWQPARESFHELRVARVAHATARARCLPRRTVVGARPRPRGRRVHRCRARSPGRPDEPEPDLARRRLLADAHGEADAVWPLIAELADLDVRRYREELL
ncbi:MAG: hypothetical protein ABR583_08720 [Gaiellaceae bacterium]